MTRSLTTFLVLVGCSSSPEPLPVEQAPTPVLGQLFATDVIPGEAIVLRVPDLPAGAQVRFFASLVGPGSGPCIQGGRTCLDIAQPFAVGGSRASSTGEATASPVVPGDAAVGTDLHLQAVVRFGSRSATTDVVMRTISAPPNLPPVITHVAVEEQPSGDVVCTTWMPPATPRTSV